MTAPTASLPKAAPSAMVAMVLANASLLFN